MGLEIQNVQDLNRGLGKAIADRAYRVGSMQGLVDSQQDFHYTQYFWLLGFPEGRL